MKPILKSVATVHGMSGEASVNHSEKHTFSKLLSILKEDVLGFFHCVWTRKPYTH